MLPVMRRNSWLPEVFDDFLNSNLMPRTNATAPAINVLENDKQYTVELAAPGLKKDDFSVNVNEDGNLSIKMGKNASRPKRTKRRTTCVASLATRNMSRRCSCPKT